MAASRPGGFDPPVIGIATILRSDGGRSGRASDGLVLVIDPWWQGVLLVHGVRGNRRLPAAFGLAMALLDIIDPTARVLSGEFPPANADPAWMKRA